MSAPIWLLAGPAPLALAVLALFLFGVGSPLGVSPISALLTLRAPAAIRPQVVSAFFALTSAGIPLGALAAGYAIDDLGFRATYAGVAALLSLATLLLAASVRRIAALPEAAPATAS